MTKLKKSVISVLALITAGCITTSTALFRSENTAVADVISSSISKVNGTVKTNVENYFDDSVVYKLPDTVSDNDEISVIVDMKTDTVLDAYNLTNGSMTFSDYVTSTAAENISKEIEKKSILLKKQLNSSGISYTSGEVYDTILSGFEITIKASDFEKVSSIFSDATLIVGEVYEPCETEVVTNDVDVYDTGIFDSSSSQYQGDGVVVAVLDTGLDYTHTAFSVDNFTTTQETFTLQNVSEKVSSTTAAGFSAGLTGEDVYVSKKVPYAYDYADKDADVFPINSEHGTHVAGIIAGKDDEITGVAPNAQLAIMKVFSDTASGAKTSWILAALEDCVTLGVDVINMSLGSSCGFSREVDKENVNVIYDKIKECGISLICAASNDYNATFGSTKNGNNGLTTNPDSGTVGSPSTYDAALSVASIDGVKTPYLVYNDDIIYFNEATTNAAKKKTFVDDILKTVGDDVTYHEFEYVTISGLGREADYTHDSSYYSGKIVLVKRGTTTFEEKVRIALKVMGAAGIIIYNNVSGTISMSVGSDIGAVCSISQDDGEKLAAQEEGTLIISKENVAGPFMSDFSSWGPTSDLKIKPEITAHGGEIYSCVPGQSYDRLSGTSMAAPNQAGATALIRQYVKSGAFGNNITSVQTTAIVNQLMMSTADIIYNKNGLPYSVRKQGSGLVNITKALSSASYITTYDTDGKAMDKTKLELGDDKKKTGVYEMTFDINNVTSKTVTYDVNALVMTEGVSSTWTSHGDQTVSQDGRMLDGAVTTVTSVSGGTQSGNAVTVSANGTATVKVKIVLSDADKQYMDEAFAYGMYVEGFITLTATEGTDVSLNIPMLAFYGDWTQAPIFDEEYYDTNADEINAGIDDEDKLMADAYATRVIGGLYSDYIATLGSYYFIQNPSATQIAADKDHISLSNQTSDTNATINYIRDVYAGLLRNVKEMYIVITEDSTGEVVYSSVDYNVHKSYSSGSTIYPSTVEVDFSAADYNLKNNTQYTVTLTGFIDYGEKEDQKNVRSTFSFPVYIDFEAPVITDVTYRTEYDRTTKETKLYADLSIYDNHYAMAVQLGQITRADPSSGYAFTMNTFGKYITPVYSSFNSTSIVTIELTDYINDIKNSSGLTYNEDGTYQIEDNNNSFIAICYDYAMNMATYEISLPDEILAMYFADETVSLSPNETMKISDILSIYPSESWLQVLDYTTSDAEIASVVNGTIVAKKSGTALITATGHDADGNAVTASVMVKVLSETDDGYVGTYSIPEINSFSLTGYKTNKAYYETSSSDRDIGVTDGSYDFGSSISLSMYPSESVTLTYKLEAYFPEKVALKYSSGNKKVATVSDDGTIVAQTEGTTIINVTVTFDGKNTLYSARVAVTVKDPYTINSIYLMSYKGLGGTVEIPADRGITTIYAYAFSNYNYVEKDLTAGDVIDEEDPYYIKQMYIGEDTITKVIIPEGVTEIQSYAFAKLTALEEVVLPTTLKRIGVGAFLGCEKLSKINLDHVQFINKQAFSGCALTDVNMNSIVAIGDYSFENCKLGYIVLPESSQSLGIGAFYKNVYLTSVEFRASKIKIGSYAFAECPMISSVDINASVIASYAFNNCSALTRVNLGKDVSVIGEYAFAGTSVESFTINKQNTTLTLANNGTQIYKGSELILVAPQYSGTSNSIVIDAESIASGAFAGNTKIFSVTADNAKTIGSYAFADCTNLHWISLASVEKIEDYAFNNTALEDEFNLPTIKEIGEFAFAGTKLTKVTIGDGVKLGDGAFALIPTLESVTLGNDVVVGNACFYCPVYTATYDDVQSISYYTPYEYTATNSEDGTVITYTYYRYDYSVGITSNLKELIIGTNADIGQSAFYGCAKLESVTLGNGAKIGAYAFYNDMALTSIDLSKAESIGDYAFSGVSTRDYRANNNYLSYAVEYETVGGVLTPVSYIYTTMAPALESVNLSGVSSIGEGAFAFNNKLKTVLLPENATEISDYLFAFTSITDITLPETVTTIGTYAFYNAPLKNINLANVNLIGSAAFYRTKLTNVTLSEGAQIGSNAFAYCSNLANVVGLDKADIISSYAFMGTALKDITLGAMYIGDYAFAQSDVTSVTFNGNVMALGENPFYGCNITTFGKIADVKFNGNVIGQEVISTYDVSPVVKVINGVLYQVVPNGLELVSYPKLSTNKDYTVEEGTVRISAMAFSGASLQNVTLPSTLKAIGDKAFYGCDNLTLVVFTSYNAPILEEEYDESYISDDTMPYATTASGLNISDYYMWNVSSNYTNFYFGANFVNYIGQIDKTLMMVRPTNGQGYDTFIFSQYFDVVVEGYNAATDATVEVIALINKIPTSVTLESESLIIAARTAYDNISSTEQKALVSNYSKLADAESLLAYLKNRDNQNTNDDVVEPAQPSAAATFFANNMVGLIIAGVLLLAVAGLVAYIIVIKKKKD